VVAVPEALVPVFLRLTRANRTYITAAGARRRIRERELRPSAWGPPRHLRGDVRVDVATRRGRPVYTIAPTRRAADGGIVYLHGGGWVGEIARQHWQLAAELASRCSTTVTLPIYALVPFGTADDALALAAELALENRELRGPTVLAGDSAGGQIALSTAQHLRDRHALTVEATALISPALDLTWSNPRIPEVQPTDPWLGAPGGRVLAEHWRGSRDILDPVVSPLFGSMDGLGRLIVFTGTRDVLNPDASILHDKAREAGVDVSFHEGEGQLHVYPLLPTRVGVAAREQLVSELRAALAAA
jgi:acetyl esterase/lipase